MGSLIDTHYNWRILFCRFLKRSSWQLSLGGRLLNSIKEGHYKPVRETVKVRKLGPMSCERQLLKGAFETRSRLDHHEVVKFIY